MNKLKARAAYPIFLLCEWLSEKIGDFGRHFLICFDCGRSIYYGKSCK